LLKIESTVPVNEATLQEQQKNLEEHHLNLMTMIH